MTLQKQRIFSNRMLLLLIVPLIVEQGLAILVGMVDGMMVSSVGEVAISGVSLVDMISNMINKLFAALATGGAVVTSQYLGGKNYKSARESVSQLFLMATVFGLLLMILSLISARWLLKLLFGAIEQPVMDAALIYFRITALSYPFISLYNAGAAVFRSLGNSKISMKVGLVMNLINVAGNAICIYGLKMGVAGVAIPTLISRIVAAAVICWLVSRPSLEISLNLKDLKQKRPDMMKRILRIGVPSGCENSFFELGRILVVSMIALYGTTQTSANAVANNLDSLGVMMSHAVSLAMITVVGQCVGAGDEEQIKYYMKKLMVIAYVLCLVPNLLVCGFLPQLLGLYTLSPETTELAAKLVRIHTLCGILIWPAAFVLPNALRAANDVRYSMYVGIGSMVGFRLVFSWILCVHMGMGAVGVWIAMVLDWICRSSLILIRVLNGKWKKACGLISPNPGKLQN